MEKVIELINSAINGCYGTMSEIEDVLSDMFVDKVEECEDAQVAFDELNDEIGNNILFNYFCYCLSDGGEWTVDCSKLTNDMIAALNDCGWSVSTTDDVESSLTHKLQKTMGNVGCDVKTALHLEFEDFPKGYPWENVILIDIPDGNPCISFLE